MSAKTELEKIRQMNGRDRLWYIWEYYKFHMAAVVLALVVVSVIGQTVYRSSFHTALHVIYLNSRSEEALDMTPMDQGFAKYLGLGKKDEILSEEAFISVGEDATEYSYASMAKISALASAGELDVLIGDTEVTDHYASMDSLMDLENGLSQEIRELIADRLYYAENEEGSRIACGIDLTGTKFAEESHLAQDIPLLSILINTKRTDTAEQLIAYIFAQ